MAENIVTEDMDSTDELKAHYDSVLNNFMCRMPLRKAEDMYGMERGELKAAIEQGKIRFYKVGKTQYRVTPEFIAEYIEKYCTFQNVPLPS